MIPYLAAMIGEVRSAMQDHKTLRALFVGTGIGLCAIIFWAGVEYDSLSKLSNRVTAIEATERNLPVELARIDDRIRYMGSEIHSLRRDLKHK